MKHLLVTTIAALVLVGCGPPPPDISIIKAATTGNVEAVKQHLAAGTDLNQQNELGETALHWAGLNARDEIVELLVANGADVNARLKDGGTPLHSAAWGASGNFNLIASELITNGANVNAFYDKFPQETPLDILNKRGKKKPLTYSASFLAARRMKN